MEALDFSAYEGATIVHDLNQPIPARWNQQFDVVFDGGTLEHVFDFSTAIKNCMQLLRLQGRFVSVTIPNNWCGHGFYQFSPELFFRVLSPANGFSVVEMFIAELGGRCYAVKDPATVQSRVELCNSRPVFLLVHARRDRVCDLFARMPQQSDYEAEWSVANRGGSAATVPQAWKDFPGIKQLRKLRRKWRDDRRRRSHSLDNRKFYSRVDLTI